uniref:Uncharacterized protein n=1 Tax=Knipowitschia caucasica TaxID=637954 RepID=A0AAV2M6K5_KNICA
MALAVACGDRQPLSANRAPCDQLTAPPPLPPPLPQRQAWKQSHLSKVLLLLGDCRIKLHPNTLPQLQTGWLMIEIHQLFKWTSPAIAPHHG